MSILKPFITFCVIILVMWLKKPISITILAAAVVAILIYRLSIITAYSIMIKRTISWTTVEALLVLYSVTFLQRMLEKWRDLHNYQVALNELFNNRRISTSIIPFLLGCFPTASIVLIYDLIARDSVGDYLFISEKAAITSYFRHISESFLSTYTTIFVAVGLTDDAVSVGNFVLAVLPIAAALSMIGYLVYLRGISKDTGMVPDHPKPYYWKLLTQSTRSIALVILIILILKPPVKLAVFTYIIINVSVSRLNPKELVPFPKAAFETRPLVNVWLVMVFEEVLVATRIIELLPEFFFVLPIPTFLVSALILFSGTVVAGSQVMIVLCMPIAMAAVNSGVTLPLFILLIYINYVAMQVLPVHICLTFCAEDHRIPLSSMVARTTPTVLVFTVIPFLYYGLLGFARF